MRALKAVWAWVKKYPWAIVVAAASALTALALLLSRRNQVASLDDAVQIRAAVREVARKEGAARALEARADAKAEDVTALRRDIAASKKRIMEIYNAQPLDDKSDDVVARMFTAAGF